MAEHDSRRFASGDAVTELLQSWMVNLRNMIEFIAEVDDTDFALRCLDAETLAS